MSNYDNNNRGALFVNDRKEKDTHPDYRGTAEVEGVECWISCWIKEPRGGGKKYLSLAFTPKEEQASSAPRRTATSNDAADFLAQNQAKANTHKQGGAPKAPNQPKKPDFDSFDEDIPF
ncbi:hypothetical protein D3C76_163770 [compost metagenome]